MLKPIKRHHKKPKHKISPWMIYLIVFGLTLHLSPALYINSSFLETVVQEKTVGFIYSLASIITVFVFFFIMTRMLRRFGNYKSFMGVLFLEFISLGFLALAPSATVVILAFIIHFITTSIGFMCVDIFLEDGSKDESTGGMRGVLLSTSSIAFGVGPFVSGIILETGSFWLVYVLGMVILAFVIIASMMKLRDFQDPEYAPVTKKKIVEDVFVHKNVYFAMQVGFILRFFYAWMIIYSPIFLRGLGFDWNETGLILAIGLIPFIILEAPLGVLADKYHSEKTQMAFGFIIMSLSSMAIYFAPEVKSILLWSSIIFIGRIGASLLEVSSESYLFKNIKSDDLPVLTFFRTIRPISYVLAPIVASILIPTIGLKGLFLVLSLYLIYGLRYSFSMQKM
jgi:MFS family permease